MHEGKERTCVHAEGGAKTWCLSSAPLLCKIILQDLPTCLCVSLPVTHVCQSPWTPEEGIRYRGIGITGSCEPPDMGAGKRSWVLGPPQGQ